MSPYYADEHVTLWHGDCLELAYVWTVADVLVTDPPYGQAFRSNSAKNYGQRERAGDIARSITNDGDTLSRDRALALWGADRPALIFGTWRTGKPAGVRNTLVWDKGGSPGMGSMNLPWGNGHEEIYLLGRNATPDTDGWRPSGRRASSIVRVPGIVPGSNERPHGEFNHPTPKPSALLELLIAKCPPGAVADPFAGSGSTLVAAKSLGRRAVGVELDERYCEIAAKRLAQGVLDFGATA